jgi:hypothetical protein
VPFTNVLKVYQRAVFNIPVISLGSIWLQLGGNDTHHQATATGVTARGDFLTLDFVALGFAVFTAEGVGLAVTNTGCS